MSDAKKKLSKLWQCDKCQCLLMQNDFSLHKIGCPPQEEKYDYSFIWNKVLYCTIGALDLKEIPKNIPKNELDDLVFISPSIMQSCNITMASSVVIAYKEKLIVKTAFPYDNKNLISISLMKHIIELNNIEGQVKVQSLTSDIVIAEKIVISEQGKPSKHDMGIELSYILKAGNEDRIFVIGNKISVPYYGRKLIYKIIKIKAEGSKKEQIADANDPLESFKALTIDPANTTFYKALFATEWIVLSTTDESKVNKYNIDDIGGYNALIYDIKAMVASFFSEYRYINANRGILLHGLVGVGKAMIAKAVISECNINMFSVSHSDIDSNFNKIKDELRKVFKSATSNTPSAILLEDIDQLINIEDASGRSYKKVITKLLITLFDDLKRSNEDVLVIVTTSELDSIDISLRKLNTVFQIDRPTRDARTEILTKMLSKIPNTLLGENVKDIAWNTNGFVGADLSKLCSEASTNAIRRQQKDRRINEDQPIITMIDFDHALSVIKPYAMMELQTEIPNVKWSDIGGQKELKRKLQQAIEWPLRYPESFARHHIKPPKGILMYGPPGCSKTMAAKALATECKVNFIKIEVTQILEKWVGESEKAVKKIFQKAKQVAPSIIFIDEIDALCSNRSSSSETSDVHARVLTQLLIELDGFTALENVTFLAATNRPDRIDKALLRPGRFDDIIYVGLPDEETRHEIFDIKLRKMCVTEEVNVSELACLTEGYSGAEIHRICDVAVMKALEEDLNCDSITRNHLMAALETVTPRTSHSLIRIYEKFISNEKTKREKERIRKQ